MNNNNKMEELLKLADSFLKSSEGSTPWSLHSNLLACKTSLTGNKRHRKDEMRNIHFSKQQTGKHDHDDDNRGI